MARESIWYNFCLQILALCAQILYYTVYTIQIPVLYYICTSQKGLL